MTNEELKQFIENIGDMRWRKIDDCDEIKEKTQDDINALRTDVAVLKAMLKGILAVVSVVGAFIIPACLKIIMGV